MSNITVAIISNDTLSALGLKYSLSQFFDINPTLFNSIDKLIDTINNHTEHFDLFITTANLFSTNLDIFLPRRGKTLIIANDNNIDDNNAVINPHSSQEEIIELLNQHINKLTENNDEPHSELSQREIDVLRLVAAGYLNKEIADELSISINTVLTHRKNITFKLGIRSVSGLSFYAMMNGYIKGDI
ncbi:MAG: helix-turn-helix transcriptional regulator [Bacteroidales bacterium]